MAWGAVRVAGTSAAIIQYEKKTNINKSEVPVRKAIAGYFPTWH
jgi:hypothetical protein